MHSASTAEKEFYSWGSIGNNLEGVGSLAILKGESIISSGDPNDAGLIIAALFGDENPTYPSWLKAATSGTYVEKSESFWEDFSIKINNYNRPPAKFSETAE